MCSVYNMLWFGPNLLIPGGSDGFVDQMLCRQLFVGLSASLGGFSFAAVCGWVAPLLPSLLGPDSEIPMTTEQASWMVSIADLAALLTPIPAAMLADRIGRKPVILLTAPMYALGWVMILSFRTYLTLIVARFIQGSATGTVLSVIPVYIGEIASTEYRGAITSLFFITSWAGFLFEYSTGPFLSMTNFTLLNLSTTVLYFLLFSFQSETPYFYLMKDKRDAAQKSLEWLRCSTMESVSEELKRISSTVEEDKLRKTSWKEVVATPTDRKALYILLFVGCLRVSSGLVSVLSYATEIFQETLNLEISATDSTILLGVVLMFGSSISFFIIDTVGRRPLLIASCAISSICLCIASVFFYLQQETSVDVSSYSLLSPLAILTFAAVAVAGVSPVSTAYSSELFNSKTRVLASGLNVSCVTACSFLLRFSYQYFAVTFGVYFNFLLYTVVCVVGLIVSYLYMPETRKRTFEQIRKELSSD